MKLSISNIAWNTEEDQFIIPLLKNMGIHEIEIAPTKFWERPLDASVSDYERLKLDWENKGVLFIAMQSLLFGQNHFNIFSNHDVRQQMLDYLKGIITLAGKLGVQSLVFGSPKNRLAGELAETERMDIAVPFFFELGSFAAQENTTLCIEANPKGYGCDFITNTEEAISLVQKVNHPGFQLHLDAGAMELNNEDVYSTIEKAMPYLKHFHISEPYLNLVGTGQTKHKEMAGVLKTLGYKNWVSIEMKSGLSSSNIQSVEKALAFALKTYV